MATSCKRCKEYCRSMPEIYFENNTDEELLEMVSKYHKSEHRRLLDD